MDTDSLSLSSVLMGRVGAAVKTSLTLVGGDEGRLTRLSCQLSVSSCVG